MTTDMLATDDDALVALEEAIDSEVTRYGDLQERLAAHHAALDALIAEFAHARRNAESALARRT